MRGRTCVTGLILGAVILAGCPSAPPTLLPIGDRETTVGQTLEFVVAATSPDGARLQFAAEDLPTGAQFVQFADTQARFTWSPTAADTGDHAIDFLVFGRRHQDSERVIVRVNAESSGGPTFVGPTTFTLEEGQKSMERILEVQDPTATEFAWSIDNAPAGATFTPLFRQAVFFWEPTAAQRTQPQYSFTVTVTNDDGQSASQVFTILIRDGGGGGECPGGKPSVDSVTPSHFEGANDFEVTAVAYDADGEIVSVLLRWAQGEEPASTDYRQLEMAPGAVDSFRATVRLDEDLEPGGYVTISYVICAFSDQGEGCEQEACTPRRTFTAQRRGGGGLCAPCTASSECGGDQDLCLVVPTTEETFCATDCSTTLSCPSGYQCTAVGDGDQQCVPLGHSCESSEFRPAEPGDLVINEILPAPPPGVDVNGDGVASTLGDEYVELVSVAADPVDIGGFTVSDRVRVRYTFPVGTVVPPGEAVVVFGGGDPAAFSTDFGGAQVFSVIPDNPEGHGLQLADAGDEVLVHDPDFVLIAAASYGDLRGVPTADRHALTLEPQATGIVYVPTSETPDTSGAFAPGRQSCGLPFPIALHGDCGGRVCGDRPPNTDAEPNDTRSQAACLDGSAVELEGTLAYHGTNEATHPGPDPADYFAFHARAGQTLDVITFPCETDSVEDTYLEVLDAAGRLLVENDDYEGVSSMLHAEIHDFTIPATGTHYLVVRTFQGSWNDEGCYTLWLLLDD
jgi:hypothetical protein